MTGKAYSAGTIFLQVVPVFGDTMNAIRREARDMNREVSADLGKEVEKGIDEGSKRGVDKLEKNLGKTKAKVDVDLDTDKAERALGTFERHFRDRMKAAAKSFGDDTSGELQRIQAEMRALGDKKIGIDIDSKQALADAARLRKEIELLAAKGDLDIDVVVNSAKARAELIAIDKMADRFDGRTLRAKADVDIGRAAAKLTILGRLFNSVGGDTQRLRGHLDSTGNSFRAFNFVILAVAAALPMIVPLLGAVGGALLALLPILAGVTAGLGVMLVGFSGIGNALTALSNVQKNAAKDSLAASKTMKGAARSVADAHRSLTQARQDAARRQADAARAVAEAERNSSEQIRSALRAQEDAERSLARAQEEAKKAQDDLREARKQAQDDLEAAADRSKGVALDIRQAQIDLFNATVENNAAQADPGSTNLEREQASINLGQAKLRLKDLRDEQKALNDEVRKGVKGNEGVKSAEDAVVQALQARADAQRNLADAERNVNQARLDGARQVSDALRNQAQAQQDSARSIADAKRNLTQAEQDYRDALVQTDEIGSASINNLHDAMMKLSPAGRHFARFLFGMREEFYKIRGAIQETMLPGVEAGIRAVMKHSRQIRHFAHDMGDAIGDLFKRFGRTMANSPVWQQFWKMMDRLGPLFTRQFGKTLLNWLGVFARLATIAAPWARKLSDVLLQMSKHALRWVNSKKGTKVIEDFLGYVERIGPKVWKFLVALVKALIAVAVAIAPFGEKMLEGLTAFLEWIATLDPKVLAPFAIAFLTLIVTFQTMVGIVSLLTGGLSLLAIILESAVLGPVLLAIGAILLMAGAFAILWFRSKTFRDLVTKYFHAIGDAATWLWEKAVKPAFNWIRDLISRVYADLVDLWKTSLKPVWDDFAKVMNWLWHHVIKPVWNFIWELVKAVFKYIAWAWEHILGPVIDTFGRVVWVLWTKYVKVVFKFIHTAFQTTAMAMKWTWHNVIQPIFDAFMWLIGNDLVDAFQGAVNAIKRIWDTVAGVIGKPVKFVIQTVLNDGLIHAFNWIAGKVGGTKIETIPVPDFTPSPHQLNRAQNGTGGRSQVGMHTGGIYPGYTPGRDIGTINVSGGEAIMRPEWTRAIGPEMVHKWNKLARTGGVDAVRKAMGFLGGFARGGVVWPTVGRSVARTAYNLGHDGVDINQPPGPDFGAPIYAYRKGRITYVGWNRGYGQAIFEQGDVGPEVVYGHTSKVAVRAGQSVSAGQVIGYVGDTGNATGAHLHFGIPGGTFQQAMALLNGAIIASGSAAGMASSIPAWAKAILGNVSGWVKDKIGDAAGDTLDKFGWWGETLLKGAMTLVDPVADKIGDLLGGLTSAASGLMSVAGIKGPVVDQVRAVAAKYGWDSGAQWDSLYQLIAHESSWNPNAANPNSSARGLFQKMTSMHGAVEDTAAGQAAWGLNYIKHAYGTPANAWAQWQSRSPHWYAEGGVVPGDVADNGSMKYDSGGYLPPGMTTVLNLTGKPEPVFTSEQFAAMRGRGGDGAGLHYEPHFYESDLTAQDVTDDLEFTIRKHGFGGVYSGGGQ